jgi:hypothetical protein
MNDVGKWLKDADPLASLPRDAGLARDEAQAMRRTILAALDERRSAAAFWPRPLAMAATIALTLASGIVLGRHLSPPRGVERSASAAQFDEVRQLQFSTPGGTRVIWVFNPEFQP